MRRMDDFERTVEKLRGVDVEEYHLESEEAVAAAAVKAYLIDFTWQEAREEYSIKNPAASCKAGTFEGYDKRGKAGRSY